MPSDEKDTSIEPAADADETVEPSETNAGTDGETVDEGTGSETGTEPESGDQEEDGDEIDPESIDAIETIVVDPEDVVETAAYNGQEDIGRKGKAVFGLTPPFRGTVEPTIRHLADDSTESKAENEVHLRPFRFVAKGQQVIEQRPTRRLAREELDADDPDEATIEAWIDEAMGAWKDHVRENLVGSIDVYSAHGMAFVDVEYEEGG